jgi:hypothetical protein
MLTEPGFNPSVNNMIIDPIAQISHGGSGVKYAVIIINNRSLRFHPDYIKKTSILKIQNHIRGLYKAAAKIQPKSDPEFGGHYHEVTITNEKLIWSAPTA